MSSKFISFILVFLLLLISCDSSNNSAEIEVPDDDDDVDDDNNDDDAADDDTADDDSTDDDDDTTDDDDDDDDQPEGKLVIIPEEIMVEQWGSKLFEAFIVDQNDNHIPVDVEWEAAPDAGAIDQEGLFIAGESVGIYKKGIQATFEDQSAFAKVTVTTARADFIWGFSHAVQPESIYIWSSASYEEKLDRLVADFLYVGTSWYRTYIIWKDVDPVLENPELARGDITDDMVEAYAFEDVDKNWEKYDLLIEKLGENDIHFFMVVGAGYTWELPRVEDQADALVAALPDTIGYENYIAQACLHVKAAVRRYKGFIKVWVTEAELNMAGPTVLWGWRDGEAWWDWSFKTDLLSTLSDCVHEEDPEAQVTMNFHTDILWKNHVRKWAQYLDIISLDAFPNYFISDPVLGKIVGNRVRQALELGTGKPVVIQETSYPTGVSYFDFSEAKQARYIEEGATAVFEAGGSGYYHFKLSAAEELGGGPWYRESESKYGLIRTDDTYKPGYFAYRDIIELLMSR